MNNIWGQEEEEEEEELHTDTHTDTPGESYNTPVHQNVPAWSHWVMGPHSDAAVHGNVSTPPTYAGGHGNSHSDAVYPPSPPYYAGGHGNSHSDVTYPPSGGGHSDVVNHTNVADNLHGNTTATSWNDSEYTDIPHEDIHINTVEPV